MSAGEVHLWLASPADVPAGGDLGILDDHERARAARFRFDRHREIFVAAHLLVRRVLEHHGGAPAAAWRFGAGAHGRPFLTGPRTELHFNLSHTDGLVACIVGPQEEIGVDVEHTDRGGRLLDVADRYFSVDEARALRELPPEQQSQRFLEYWTLKESYIKARGLGLALPLGQFTFLPDRRPIGVRFDAALGDDAARWRFTLAPHGPRHLVATAVAAPLPIAVHDGAVLLRA